MATRAPIVKPEFGPSLFEMLGPRARPVLAVAAVLVVAVLVWLGLGGGKASLPNAVVRKPVAFNLLYTSASRRAAPEGRETFRLVSKPGNPAPYEFTVTPLRLPPYKGDVSGQLTFMSAGLIDRMRKTIPGFVWRGDGRVNVNQQPGYQIVYQAKVGGKTVYGKRILLVKGYDPPPREGLDITMQAARSGAIPSADAVGLNGPLKTSYRSLRFGTERP